MRKQIAVLLLLVLIGLPATAGAQTVKVLDDFKTGPQWSVLFTGNDLRVQAGSMVGGFRRTNFIVIPNPVVHPGIMQVRSGGPLIVSAGYKVSHRLEVFYGVDGAGANAPLNLDLSAYDRLVVDFDGSDAGVNFNIVIWWASGALYAAQGINLAASSVPFSVQLPFDRFTPGIPGMLPTFNDIDYIAVIAQSGSAIGANDYAITTLRAVGP